MSLIKVEDGFVKRHRLNSSKSAIPTGWRYNVLAAAASGSVQALEYFEKSGLPVLQTKSDNGATLTHFAARFGQTSILQWLQNKKARIWNAENPTFDLRSRVQNWVQEKDKHGCDALVYAAEGGHIQVIEWLLARCASMDQCAEGHRLVSIAHFASGGDHEQLLRWLVKKYPECVRGQDEGDYSLWHVAAASGGTKVLRYLHTVYPLRRDPNPDAIQWHSTRKVRESEYRPLPDFPNSPLLVVAASSGNLSAVKWLITQEKRNSDTCLDCQLDAKDSTGKLEGSKLCETCRTAQLVWLSARSGAHVRKHSDVVQFLDGVKLHRECATAFAKGEGKFGQGDGQEYASTLALVEKMLRKLATSNYTLSAADAAEANTKTVCGDESSKSSKKKKKEARKKGKKKEKGKNVALMAPSEQTSTSVATTAAAPTVTADGAPSLAAPTTNTSEPGELGKTHAQLSQNILQKRRHTPLFSQRRNGMHASPMEPPPGPPLRRTGSARKGGSRKSTRWISSLLKKSASAQSTLSGTAESHAHEHGQLQGALEAAGEPEEPELTQSDSDANIDVDCLVDEVYG